MDIVRLSLKVYSKSYNKTFTLRDEKPTLSPGSMSEEAIAGTHSHRLSPWKPAHSRLKPVRDREYNNVM